jgi:hypothetical protein
MLISYNTEKLKGKFYRSIMKPTWSPEREGGQDGAFAPLEKLIERLITRFAIEQLLRLQFLFDNN